MYAIAINGSARPNGNTATLLRACLEVLEEGGISGELVQLAENPIRPCKACGTCFSRKDNTCIIAEDAFQQVYDKMRAADIILLGSPVYFGSATADLMALLDRAGYVGRANGNVFARKLGGPVVVARRAGQNFTLAQLLFWFMIMDMIVPGSSYWNIGFGRLQGEVSEDNEGIETVRHFAQNLVWLANKLCRKND
ncbi:MAG: 2-amino-4-deoxychorismate dehydrogenase [Candidatus Hydrogenedentes bacterium ADurb.Bin101]|nr:MAG: 2-amino-4-deoxychorismate dehydrogenase [Candidatus Hydrogenedentes bacterium ADurb.Bin101]